jgi:hypothetical protein
MVHDLGDTMKREDCHHWLACAKEFLKLPLVDDVLAAAVNTEHNDGMDEPIVNSDEATPGQGPLLILSQFHNTTHSGADMNLRGDEFTQCPSFS